MNAQVNNADAAAASREKLNSFIADRISELSGYKSQRDIAKEAGWTNPNMLSMIKRGESKLPLDRVPALAKALEVDPGLLFRLALEQYWPAEERIITQIFGAALSQNERTILQAIRNASNGSDPELTPEREQTLGEIFGE